jgi:hypothetical protein
MNDPARRDEAMIDASGSTATAIFAATTIMFICASVISREHPVAQSVCIIATFLQLAILYKMHELAIDGFLLAIFS